MIRAQNGSELQKIGFKIGAKCVYAGVSRLARVERAPGFEAAVGGTAGQKTAPGEAACTICLHTQSI